LNIKNKKPRITKSKVVIWLDEDLVVAGATDHVKRSLKERLFSRPWQPFKKNKTVTNMVPSHKIYWEGESLIMHPDKLLHLIGQSEQGVG